MALIHHAFLFDADSFRQKIDPLLDALYEGSAEPLFNTALEITQSTSQDAVINIIDANIVDISVKNFVGIPYKEPIGPFLKTLSKLESSDLGYWFLIIFSKYLQECGGIGPDFEILAWCLEKVGWRPEDIKLLIGASPMSLLLRSDSYTQPKKLSYSDPYWFWMRPAYSNRSGWLSKQQISDLLSKLQLVEQPIYSFDPKLFGNQWRTIPISIPDGQIDYLTRAKFTYDLAVTMLTTADLKNNELYIVISES